MVRFITFTVALLCLQLSSFVLASTTGANHHTQRNHELLWFQDDKLTLSGLELLSLMADLGMRQSSKLASFEWSDIPATDEYLTQGLLSINKIVIGHQVEQRALTAESVHEAWQFNKLAGLIDSQLPQFPEVLHLRRAISRMRELSQSDWPAIPGDFSPRLGQRHKHVASLIDILVKLGDFTVTNSRLKNDFTPQVKLAIKTFQRRHGLPASGKLDQHTREKLSWTPEQRLAILQQNLYRWLSLPALPPERYILVNIPSYKLSLWEHGRETLTMPVVVGAPETPTPIMLTEIDRVTANPQWVPPSSIVKGELLSQLASSPGLMASQKFHWVNRKDRHQTLPLEAGLDNAAGMYRSHMLVQGPGPSNALGKWRFNIKNNDAIYLHDTPVKHLFSATHRALSHGCIRLAAPEQLALSLLKPTDFAPDASSTIHTRLSKSVPTYINYQTVEINNEEIVWLRDIYAQDRTQFRISASQEHATKRN